MTSSHSQTMSKYAALFVLKLFHSRIKGLSRTKVSFKPSSTGLLQKEWYPKITKINVQGDYLFYTIYWLFVPTGKRLKFLLLVLLQKSLPFSLYNLIINLWYHVSLNIEHFSVHLSQLQVSIERGSFIWLRGHFHKRAQGQIMINVPHLAVLDSWERKSA